MPDVEYSHPPTLNIGESPGAGSVSVPVKVLVAVVVPRSSIPVVVPVPPLKIRSVDPSLRRTVPVAGRAEVLGGFCHVELVSAPSARTLRCAVSTCPSASDPPEHGRVVVFRTVNDQLPVACVCVMAPPPAPPRPINVVVLFSQATVASSVRQNRVGRTLGLQNVLRGCAHGGRGAIHLPLALSAETLHSCSRTGEWSVNLLRTQMPPDPNTIVHEVFSWVVPGIVLIILGFPVVRLITKWLEPRPVPPRELSTINVRLERIEAAVDAIALEVERVSESQRFTRRLQSERQSPRLPGGQANLPVNDEGSRRK